MTEPGPAGDPETTVEAAPSADTELAGFAEADTQSAYAWGQVDDLDEPPQHWWTPRRITTAAVISSVLVAAAVAGLTYRYIREDQGSATRRQTSAASTTVPETTQLRTAVTPTHLPPTPAIPAPPVLYGIDGEFIAAIRGYGVPVSEQDPQWTVGLAHAVCGTAKDNPPLYPPGKATVLVLVGGLMKNNPDWTRQQATRFTEGAVDYYCPWLGGPSQREIAAMPANQRYLAMLQDRLGITPTDSGASLINAARQWCDWKAQGWQNYQVVDATTLGPNNRKDLPEMVEIGIDVYCPEFKGR